MTITIRQTSTALGPSNIASFSASGGVAPYGYSILPNGAGGSIGPLTGIYTAPTAVNSDPKRLYDRILVTDALSDTASASILVGSPLLLFCEIIERSMSLSNGRVFLWDQKIFQPNDSGLYAIVSVPSLRPFANVNAPAPSGGVLLSDQSLAVLATLDIDLISRGPDARDRKEELLLALNSTYSQQQQSANGFFIGKLPAFGRFLNISEIDGAAIPYRYRLSVNMQYVYRKSITIDHFDIFDFEETIEA